MAQKMDLTQGPLFKKIFIYSVPLIFTFVLQMLFNIADMIVAGNFAGDNALGAIGSTPQVMFFCMGFLMGLGGAVNAITAYYIGAKKSQDIQQTVHTGAIICFLAGVFFFILANILGRPVLILLKTKTELLDDAVLYYRICSIGFIALGIYNWGNGILSAKGNTHSPLIYLCISGILNFGLNILFITVFKMTVDGVAWATVISQFLSAVLITLKLLREQDDCTFSFSKLHASYDKTIQLLKVGVPSGLQNAIFAFANSFLMMGINSFDKDFVVANSIAQNTDNLVYNVMAAFYTACSSFIGQNYGAKNKKRILHSYLISQGYAMLFAIIIGGLYLIFGHQIISLFSKNPHVIELGYYRIAIMAFSLWLAPLMDGTTAASRGLGKTIIPTIIILLGSCAFRIIWVYTAFASYKSILSLFLLFPISWLITGIAEIIYFGRLYSKIRE